MCVWLGGEFGHVVLGNRFQRQTVQIIEEKMDLGWVMLGEMVHCLEEKKTKSLSNHKQR